MSYSFLARIFTTSFISALCLSVLHADTKQKTEKKKPLVEITRSPSIYDGCDIIKNRSEHTIIPKKCILYIPEKLKNRVSLKPAFYSF